MPTIAVTGLSTPLGRAVADELAASGAQVVGARLGGPVPPSATTLVITDRPEPVSELSSVLSVGPGRTVLISSAMAYGAWADNPVPLTEDAPLRPNPGCEPAVAAAEAERLAGEWVRDADGSPRSLVVLRAARVVGDEEGPLAPERDAGAPVQFLHVSDLARAAALAATGDMAGVYNAAPDGWVGGEDVDALVHGPLALPRRIVRAIGRVASALAGPPPALAAFRQQPWVVANDRLRAAGWQPTHTNEEAWVSSQPPSKLQELSPSRRQALALGISGAALAAGGVGVAVALRGARRRAR